VSAGEVIAYGLEFADRPTYHLTHPAEAEGVLLSSWLSVLADAQSYAQITDVVEGFRVAFNAELQRFLSWKATLAHRTLPPLAREALRDYLAEYAMRNGKRLRPLMMCCGYYCLGGENAPAVLRASVCVELLQTALIIHDDVIDRSRVRREGPTMQLLWEEYLRRQPCDRPDDRAEHAHYGISMAIIMGDIASALAYEALTGADFPLHHKLSAIHAFSDVIYRVAFGELLDVDLGMREFSTLSEDDLLRMYELKTSGYTTEGPLQIGAALGGARAPHLRWLSEYGVPLGVIFQIQDDLLGMFGDPAEIKKDAGADLLDGKRTPLILRAWRASRGSQKQFLTEVLGSRELAGRTENLERVRAAIVQTGALDYALELIELNLKKVRRSLQRVPEDFDPCAAGALYNIARYIEEREDYRGAIQRHAKAV
jgi:geranylgeranyl diphosphate synthase type I